MTQTKTTSLNRVRPGPLLCKTLRIRGGISAQDLRKDIYEISMPPRPRTHRFTGPSESKRGRPGHEAPRLAALALRVAGESECWGPREHRNLKNILAEVLRESLATDP
jgi:hypothetical protein